MSKQIDPELYFKNHSPKAYYRGHHEITAYLGKPGETVVSRDEGEFKLAEHMAVTTDREGHTHMMALDPFFEQYRGELNGKPTKFHSYTAPFQAILLKEAVSFKTAWGETLELPAGAVLTRQRDAQGKLFYDGSSVEEFNRRHVRSTRDGRVVIGADAGLREQTRAIKNQVGQGNREGKAHLSHIAAQSEGLVRAAAVKGVTAFQGGCDKGRSIKS